MSDNIDKEKKSIALKGFIRILQLYHPKEELQDYFYSAFTKFKELKKPIEIISIMNNLLDQAKVSKGLFGFGATCDIDESVFRNSDIILLVFEFLKTNIDDLVERKDRNCFKDIFSFITAVKKKTANISLVRNSFFELWIWCFNSTELILKQEFISFIKDNYLFILIDLDIFPFYFEQGLISQVNLIELDFLHLFTELLVLDNKKRLTTISFLGDDVFEVKERIDFLTGLNQAMDLLCNIKDLTCLYVLIEFVDKLYKSFSCNKDDEFVMKNYKNLINRFKAFAIKAVKKEDNLALKNMLRLLNYVLENMFVKFYIKNKSNEKIKIKMSIGKNIKTYTLKGNLSLIGLLEKVKSDNGLSDEYDLLIGNTIISNAFFLENTPISQIGKNSNGDILFKMAKNYKMVSLNRIRKDIRNFIADSKEVYEIITYCVESGNKQLIDESNRFLQLIPPLTKSKEDLKKKLMNGETLLGSILNKEKSAKNTYILYILELLILENDFDDQIKKKIASSYLESLINILSLETDLLNIEDKIKTIKIINKCIPISPNFKIELLNRKGIVSNLMNLINKIELDEDNIDKAYNKKSVIVLLFTLKRFKHLSFSVLFENMIINKYDASLLSIFNSVISEISITQENQSEVVDYLREALKKYKELNYNIINLKLMNRFLNETLIEEFVEMAKEIVNQEVLKQEEDMDLGSIKIRLKLLIDFVTKFKSVNLEIDNNLANWIDYYFLRLENSKGLITKLFGVTKDSELIELLFSLILLISSDNKSNFNKITTKIEKFFEYQVNRTSTKPHWSRDQKQDKQSSNNNFRGLTNLGSTCYINSLFQQLYTNPHFTEFILNLDIKDKESILYKFKYLLLLLKESTRTYINPEFLIRNLTDFEGNPINVKEQMDVDEFLINFMDKLETELKKLKGEKILLDGFTGQLYQEIIGIDCKHVNTKIDNFLTITVPLNGINKLENGLSNFTHWEFLEGKNSYQCYTCDNKISAKKRISIHNLPNTLIITLKRFHFDYKKK